MKILYISKAESADFLCDTLFHGLRTLLGPNIVDVNRLWFAYKDGFADGVPWHTFYGLLPGDQDVDRTDILEKIRKKYFDYIFYGSVHRCRTYLPDALASSSKLVFVDGEDDDFCAFERIEPQNISPPESKGYRLPRVGFYFKRELPSSSTAIPIQFSMPKEKVVLDMPKKVRLIAPVDPRDPATYKFSTQSEYFQQYGESYFAFTMKKGGWDCARHYEIIAAGAIPYFLGLDHCPEGTLTFLPKTTLLSARILCDNWWKNSPTDRSDWDSTMADIRENFFRHLTTEAMAKYVLERISR